MKQVVAAVALALVGAACGGGGTSSPSSTSSSTSSSAQTLVGTITLHDTKTANTGCKGQGSFSDIHNGTPIELINQSGKVLSTSELGEGKSVGSLGCLYSFRLDHVPTASLYQLQVGGNEKRGRLPFTSAQLNQAQWQVNLELGQSSSTTTTG